MKRNAGRDLRKSPSRSGQQDFDGIFAFGHHAREKNAWNRRKIPVESQCLKDTENVSFWNPQT